MPDEINSNPWYSKDLAKSKDLATNGAELIDHWTNLLYEDPPEGIIEKIGWYGGVFAQMMISMYTFPVGLAGFILEESLQAWGFSAFILWQADEYDVLKSHIKKWKEMIDISRGVRDNVGFASPIVFGAVTQFILASRVQADAMEYAADSKIREQTQIDIDKAGRLAKKQYLFELRIVSSPGDAEIWINGVYSGALTPETLVFTDPGLWGDLNYKDFAPSETIPVSTNQEIDVLIQKYHRNSGEMRISTFTTRYRPGKRIERIIILPDPGEDPVYVEDDDADVGENLTPVFVTSSVEGDYVVDGDTFFTTTGEKIRLIGIDAPEMGRPFSDESKDWLRSQIQDKKLTLKIQSDLVMDIYGRVLAEVRNYKGNVNVFMLDAGYAKVDWGDNLKFDPSRYNAAESVAKERGVGIWSKL